MSTEEEHITYQDYSLCSPNFINGIEFLKRGMLSQASHCFEMAYEKVSYRDLHYTKYASFCGYARVLNGDRGGLSICREVARNEMYDGDVYYNLAKSEWHYKDRKRTVLTLEQGLGVDEQHPGLRDFRSSLGVRKKIIVGPLSRNNVLINKIGKLFRK
ncbi:hypothetical protein MNBD_GAMMA09-487 [hydrothermal vent metagenome]|uniref:Uncharacterized protein n=1 Tax=hydrothermal vent metagenome TaxID=652676 RepID=A0A3B0X943_9ZZZZ